LTTHCTLHTALVPR